MATPWDALASHLVTVLPTGTNIYSTQTSTVVSPAVVIRPDDPWISVTSQSWCIDEQRYLLIAVAGSAEPQDAQIALYAMVQAVIQNLPAGWSFESVGSIILDQSTDTAFLVAPIRLRYNRTAEES